MPKAGVKQPLASGKLKARLLRGDSRPPQPGGNKLSRPPNLAGKTTITMLILLLGSEQVKLSQLSPATLTIALTARQQPGLDKQ